MARKLDPTLLHAITPPAFDKSKLHRADLVDRIHANLEKSLIVIAAPAGYGKTTLLADFTAHTDQTVCWVRLADETTDALYLAQLVAGSIQRRSRKAGRSRPPSFSADTPPEGVARILAAWIEKAVGESLVVIFDDVHVLEHDAGGHAFIDELVRLRPSELTVIVSGREVPELSLARLLAEGELAGLGPADLALSRKEIRDLSEMIAGPRHQPADVDRISNLTRGWVTGVVLSGVVKGDAIGGITPEGSPLIYDYLSSVVLNRLPDELRQFALDVSVLPVMTPQLCDALLQRTDGNRLLRQLLRKGTFVDVAEGEVPTFSFHSLFRTFLLNTLSTKDASKRRRLTIKAATILERQGSPEAAFQLFAEAGELDRASQLANRRARLLALQGRIELLERWWKHLRSAPADSAEAAMALATAYVNQGATKPAEELLAYLDRLAASGVNIGSSRMMNLRAAILYQKGSYTESASFAEKVINSRIADDLPITRAIALEHKAKALTAMGTRLREARLAAEEAVQLMAATKDRHEHARTLLNLGATLEAQGEFRSLGAVAEKALLVLGEEGSPLELAYSWNNLATAKHRQGDLEGSIQAYAEALRHARQAANPVTEALVLFGQADVFNDVGMAMQAAQLYGEGLAIAARIEDRYLLRYGCLQTSVLYRRRGNLAVSNEWMKRALEHESVASKSSPTLIQMAAIESLAAPRNALVTLQRIQGGRRSGSRGEDQILGHLLLARALNAVGDAGRGKESAGRALTAAAVMGAEQLIAAELNADPVLRDFFRSAAGGSPVLEVVEGKIASILAFRKLHLAGPSQDSDSGKVRVNLLGRSQVLLDGRPLRGLRRQAREILFYLVDRKAVSKEVLAEMFWSTYSPGRRVANIHTAIHSIRAAMGKDAVRLEDGVYSFNTGMEVAYDVDQFERAAEIAERLSVGDPRRFFALTEAISLYLGPFALESQSAWSSERRRGLEVRYLDLVSALAEEALLRDQPQRAVEYLRRGLAIDPLRDDFNLAYLEALGRLGQVSEASSHYQRYAQLVREELGIDPPKRIRETFDRLLG